MSMEQIQYSIPWNIVHQFSTHLRFSTRIFAWHRYQRHACRQGKAHAMIKTATFDAKGNKAASKLLADANYVLIDFVAKAHCYRYKKNKKKSIGKWKKDFGLPLECELSFSQFSAHSI